MAVPYVFANATSAIPLSNLDNNFSTPVTIGNVAIQLGNTATTLGNVTMANVTITSVSTPITPTQGGTGSSSAFTTNGVAYASSTTALATGSAVTWTGTNFGISTASNTTLSVRNTAAGTNNFSQFNLGNDTDAGLLYFQSFSSTYTTSGTGLNTQNGALINGEGPGGLNLAATQAPIRFFSGGANEVGRFDSSGNLFVGQNAAFRTGDRLTVTGVLNNVASFVNNSNTSGYSTISSFLLANGGNTSTYHFWANTNAVGNWYLWGNGTSTFTSDQRLKKNIVTTRDGYLEDLCKLRVVKYNWNNDIDGTPLELGLIAQEVEQVFPGLVQEDLNPVQEDGEKYKQLKFSVLPFMLLKSIQELSALVTAQSATITSLTERITALEAK
jgi:hypothetical protein